MIRATIVACSSPGAMPRRLKQKNTAAAVSLFGRSRRSESRTRRSASTELLLRSFLFDVFYDIADGLKFFGVFVRDFDREFFFESHDELDDVERISAQIFDKRRGGRNLFRIYAELLDDDFLYLLFDWFVRHKIFP